MKKSNTLFTLAFFAILAFSSCEREQWGNAQKGPDDIDNRAEGQIGLSALKLSVDEKTATTVTRAGINTDNFIIFFYGHKVCFGRNKLAEHSVKRCTAANGLNGMKMQFVDTGMILIEVDIHQFFDE